MKFSVEDLRVACESGVLEKGQGEKLLTFLMERRNGASKPSFDLSHLLWYAGTLVVISAMGLFSTTAFSRMGGAALVFTALLYALVFVAVGHFLWHKKSLRVPGGLLIAAAVSMAPMAVYGVQDMLGYWENGQNLRDFHIWIKSSWLPMEIATLIAAGIALRFYPFPFIGFIAAFALWYMSMDIAIFWFEGHYSWKIRQNVSLYFGLLMLISAWLIDLRRYQNGDFSFWLHLFGLLAFWGGLSSMNSDSELSKALYCLINIVLVLLSVFLQRRAYAVFGALGISFYLGHLADRIFKNSLLFPFALSFIGLLIIAAGLLYYRHRARITEWVDCSLPDALKRLRPAHAR